MCKTPNPSPPKLADITNSIKFTESFSAPDKNEAKLSPGLPGKLKAGVMDWPPEGMVNSWQ